jgi:hypothetical protein
MGDIYGRKRVFLFGMCCQLLSTVGILMTSKASMVYLLLVVLGWAVTGK